MSPERIYLRHYNDSQTSPIDPHTLRLWRLGDGDIEYVRADLASPTPSLAAAPVEVQKISYPNVGENGYGVDVDYFRRELARLAESLPNRPGDELARCLRNLADTADPLEALRAVAQRVSDAFHADGAAESMIPSIGALDEVLDALPSPAAPSDARDAVAMELCALMRERDRSTKKWSDSGESVRNGWRIGADRLMAAMRNACPAQSGAIFAPAMMQGLREISVQADAAALAAEAHGEKGTEEISDARE